MWAINLPRRYQQMKQRAGIRWAPRLPPTLLKRLYDSDAMGLQDAELCDEVGRYLYERCRTFVLVHRQEVECPACGQVCSISREGTSRCPEHDCKWSTTWPVYQVSVRNHYAHTGRAIDAFSDFYSRYPAASSYQVKILLIDQLIHSFHLSESTQSATKSVASKLLEGNKTKVVRFLDELSALDSADKERWRQTVSKTIHRRVLKPDPDQ